MVRSNQDERHARLPLTIPHKQNKGSKKVQRTKTSGSESEDWRVHATATGASTTETAESELSRTPPGLNKNKTDENQGDLKSGGRLANFLTHVRDWKIKEALANADPAEVSAMGKDAAIATLGARYDHILGSKLHVSCLSERFDMVYVLDWFKKRRVPVSDFKSIVNCDPEQPSSEAILTFADPDAAQRAIKAAQCEGIGVEQLQVSRAKKFLKDLTPTNPRQPPQYFTKVGTMAPKITSLPRGKN